MKYLLERCLELSPVACCDHNPVVGCHQTETADDKFSRNDHNHNPCRQAVKLDQTDHGGAHQKFICQRVHKFAEICHKIVLSCNLAVQHIRQARHDKDRHCNIVAVCREIRRQQKEYKKRNQNYTHNG